MPDGDAPATFARHSAGLRRHPVRVVLAVLAVLALSAASVVAIEVWTLTDTFARGAVDISNGSATPAPAALNGAFDVLLVGADNAADQKGFGAARDATNNDVNILIHVAADHASGVVISIPRDTVIDQPACTDPTTKKVAPAVTAEPINTAISRGGLGCVVATVQRLTGLPVPYASLFSFEGTVAMADAVGGVPICVTKAVNDPASGLVLPAGRSVVKGRTALAYLRSRHGVGDGSDLGRISSQQAYMSSLFRTMTASGTLSNPAKLFSLATAASHAVTLSTSLASPTTMVGMALAVKGIPAKNLVFVQYPTEPDPENVNKVIPDTALATKLLARVRAGQPVSLDKSAHGYSTVTSPSTTPSNASTKAPAKPSGSHPASPSASPIAGLSGQTAAQSTCSVASSG